MNLYKIPLLPFFGVTLLLTLFFPILFPSWRLIFFAPFLITFSYQKPLTNSLWSAFGCGLILDILTPHTRLGLLALNFTLVIALLYPQKRHFFADTPTTLPLMAAIFSLFSTLLQLLFASIDLQLSWRFFLSDLVAMPLFDGAFAFFSFVLPVLLFGKPQRKGKDYFLERP